MSLKTTFKRASRTIARGAFFLLVAVAALTACSPEQEYNILAFVYPRPNLRHELEWDATKDSVIFLTSDNFTVTSEADWIEVVTNPSSTDIVNDGHSEYRVRSDLRITAPNTTGAERVGIVTVKTVFGTISAAFYQPVEKVQEEEEQEN